MNFDIAISIFGYLNRQDIYNYCKCCKKHYDIYKRYTKDEIFVLLEYKWNDIYSYGVDYSYNDFYVNRITEHSTNFIDLEKKLFTGKDLDDWEINYLYDGCQYTLYDFNNKIKESYEIRIISKKL